MRIVWFISGNPLSNQVAGWVTSAYKSYIDFFPEDEIIMVDMTSDSESHQRSDGLQDVYSIPRYGADAKLIEGLVQEINPDVITVYGTEHPYQCNVISACLARWADKTTVWIQGSVSECGKYYVSGVPEDVVKHKTFKEQFLRRMNLDSQRLDFEKRGILELDTIKKVKHVLGRTAWDYSFVKALNPEIKYYHCNETLREPFFYPENLWRVDTCKKHRVMISSCAYPIKGFHYLLDAMKTLIQEYPDVEIICPGRDFTKWTGMKRLRLSSYQMFLNKLIREYHLEKNVKFVGTLATDEMVEQMKSANVFVLSSTIENSSNALGEAMLVGMPIVAARVGGTESMIAEDEGYLFERGDTVSLADGIRKMFEDETYAITCASKAREHALITHDARRNAEALHSAYISIARNEN